jgi:cytochrome c oxidase subunit 3
MRKETETDMVRHTEQRSVGYTGTRIGMWLFLISEILLFGGVFFLYAVYRYKLSADFKTASGELNLAIGTGNTLILITSSFFITIAVAALPKGNRTLSIVALIVTMLLGLVFLFNKYFEWTAEFHRGFYPDSAKLLTRSTGEVLFFGLYFTITGLHGLHLFIGICVVAVMLILITRGRLTEDHFVPLENAGLYWHLVDIIWMFIFPLFYLIS